MKKALYFILFMLVQLYCVNSTIVAQKLFHQDIFYGGVTAGGVSGGMGTGTYNLKLHIEPGSSVRHAYIFAYTIHHPKNVIYKINGTDYSIDTNNVIALSRFPISYFDSIKLYYQDVKEIFNENITTDYAITIPEQYDNINLNEGWWAMYIYIEYDNSTLPKIATSLWINDKDYTENEVYNMKNMNTIDLNYPIGLSLMLDRLCDTIYDGSYVHVNNNNIGLIGGSDMVNASASCGGTKGHFYYQNNQLYGLDDDTPDAIMGGSDALADISSYLTSNNSYNLSFSYQNHSSIPTSFNLAFLFINAYTTPCDTFTTSISKDTAICKGEQISLLASGGAKYYWSPASGLSDTTVANPVASPDVTTLYTVRIENTLGCSRTERVLVKVESPKIKSLTIQETICGIASGYLFVNATGSTSLKYTIDSVFQNNTSFYNLSGGNYMLIVKDTNGCKTDTIINIPVQNNVHAFFTATPQTGAKPLSVHFNNQSENTNNYQWLINDSLVSNHLNEQNNFNLSGVYTVTLIAWNNDVSCVDTFKIQITVYDSLIIQIPNVFTPNNDGANDIFSIKIEGCKHLKGTILNRWGEPLIQFDKTISKDAKTIDLWDGLQATEGVYFYKIDATDLKGSIEKINGFFHLVR